MNKVLQVAWREFLATAATRGFLIGMVLVPVVIVISIFGIRTLMNEEPPRVVGRVTVVDPTGEVYPGFRDYMKPEAMAERREETLAKVEEETPEEVKELAGDSMSDDAARQAMEMLLGQVPKLTVEKLAAGVDLATAKEPLRDESEPGPDGRLLALVVLHDDAVVKREGEKRFGNYDLYVREKLDDRIESEIKGGLWNSIVDARIRLQDMDREQVEALTRVGRVRSITVSQQGEGETNEVLNMLLPAGFMVLLLVSVLSSGQYIMTSMVEDKSSRVVEVMLSAVSPMQLMAGKVLGQMLVGFLILLIYAGMGMGAMVAFAVFGLLDLWMLIYMLIFYLCAYLTIGSLMAAIGAAVNEIREAQTFMAPVMIVLMLPWILWMPISRNPDSMFAMVTSYIPPLNNFVILLRMTSTSPPPWWQVWLSILVGVAGVYAALWFASKVFRVGLLMYGKPPDFKTLLKWVRMA